MEQGIHPHHHDGGTAMKLAIMQPYFLPYLGYWQLIKAADVFVLFDDVQFIRHGWINRNRILKPEEGWQYILVPLQKHSRTALIKDIRAHPDSDWKEKILRQLEHYHYGPRTRAPYYGEVRALLEELFSTISTTSMVQINAHLMRGLCAYLDIKTRLKISSECGFDYSQVTDAGEWALNITQQMKGVQYINPMAGRHLFAPDKFMENGVELMFLDSRMDAYDQRRVFEPGLSLIDILMFTGREGTKKMLESCTLLPATAQPSGTTFSL